MITILCMFYSREHSDKFERQVCYLLRNFDTFSKNQQTTVKILSDTEVSTQQYW